MTVDQQEQKGSSVMYFIRSLYLSIAAAIGLICFIIGASGAVRLVLNHWFPVDNAAYYSPYEKSPCEVPYVEGKEAVRSDEEVADCVARSEENRQLMAQNDFNRDVKDSIALVVVGFPVWLFHFMILQRDWKKKKK